MQVTPGYGFYLAQQILKSGGPEGMNPKGEPNISKQFKTWHDRFWNLCRLVHIGTFYCSDLTHRHILTNIVSILVHHLHDL